METVTKHNFTYPTYTMFVKNVWGVFSKEWNGLDSKYKTPSAWLDIMWHYGGVTKQDIINVVCFAVLWTILRTALTKFIFKVMFEC